MLTLSRFYHVNGPLYIPQSAHEATSSANSRASQSGFVQGTIRCLSPLRFPQEPPRGPRISSGLLVDEVTPQLAQFALLLVIERTPAQWAAAGLTVEAHTT